MWRSIKLYFNYLIVFAVIAISVNSLFIDQSEKPKIDELGKPAATGEFPHHVSIQVDGKHECSGALISKKHALTSGVCVYNFKKKNISESTIQVAAGMIEVPGGTTYAVKDMNQHPEFNKMTWQNNIAVIRLVREVSMSESVTPAKLPKANYNLYDEQRLLVSGFGRDGDRPTPAVLKKAVVYVSVDQTCKGLFRNRDSAETFCAFLAPGYHPCMVATGDTVIENKENIIGIYSESPRFGCDEGDPLLFTSVSRYLSFIESQLNLAD